MEYHAIYKCRLCGEEYSNIRTGNTDLAMQSVIMLTITGNPIEAQSPTMTKIHVCDDKSYGLSDFCGYKKHAEDDA